MIKSSLTFWQSHRGVRLSQSSNELSQTWNKHAEKTPDQSQSWSRFGQLNLFANMNEKMRLNIFCKTGTILDGSEQRTFSQSRKDVRRMKRPIWGEVGQRDFDYRKRKGTRQWACWAFAGLPTIPIWRLLEYMILGARVAELGSLSSGAKMAMKIFVKRIFTIFPSNALFLHVIANLQN